MWLLPSSLSVPASECSTSESSSPSPSRAFWATSSGKPSLRLSSWIGWKRRTWSPRLFSAATCKTWTPDLFAGMSISSPPDSLANPTPPPARGKATTTNALSGPSSSASCASASPPRSSSRTSPASSSSQSLFGPSFEVWASSGLRRTWRPPQSSGRSKSGPEYFFGQLIETVDAQVIRVSGLPAPRASDGDKGGPNQRGSSGDLMLTSAVASLPAPTTSDGNGPRTTPRQDGREDAPDLRSAIHRLPAPTASDGTRTNEHHQHGESNPTIHGAIARLPAPTASDSRETGAAGYSTSSGRHSGTTLTDAVLGAASAGRRGKLNPRLSEWIMGIPVGWTSCGPSETEWSRWWWLARSVNCGA